MIPNESRALKCYDLFCGLGGWAEGFVAEDYECVGFDIEAHDYGTGGYLGTLVIRDVRSIHGAELKDATCIVASPPCQAYSYRAMPWKKAKALPPPDNTLFNECFRIQREASAAAGRYIPMVVENVRGAQKWVGPARAHYGSFYLWGDVGMVGKRVVTLPMRFGTSVKPSDAQKIPGFRFHGSGRSFQTASVNETKNADGRKEGGDWWNAECRKTGMARFGSKSNQRKAATAMIAKIPFPLAQHVAHSFRLACESQEGEG